MSTPEKAVVLSSGGLDSTTVLAMVVNDFGAENVQTVSFDYGQSHKVELRAAQGVADFYQVSQNEIVMPRIFSGTGASSLMGEIEHPDLTYKEIAEGEGVSPTYVPFRNANLISAATAFAMTQNASWVFTGVHAEDARNWAYPDCSMEFIGAMANAIYVGTYHKVRLVAPLQYMMKWEIVTRGTALGAPFHLTHSCYKGAQPACGTCPTCVERLGAFRLAGEHDPIEYAPGIDRESDRYELSR